jgi:hypothetical protein
VNNCLRYLDGQSIEQRSSKEEKTITISTGEKSHTLYRIDYCEK